MKRVKFEQMYGVFKGPSNNNCIYRKKRFLPEFVRKAKEAIMDVREQQKTL